MSCALHCQHQLPVFFVLSPLIQYAVHRSHLHTIRGSRGSFVQALLGRHNHGQLYLVSAMAVHQNSSQVCSTVTLDTDLSPNKQVLTLADIACLYSTCFQTTDGMATAASSTADISLSATESAPQTAAESTLTSAPETVLEAAQILASESAPETVPDAAQIFASESAPVSPSELVTAPDLTTVISQPTTEVSDAPVLAMDVLQGAGAELSLSELGLGSYTPVGLIQNLLEFMHVSIGLPWWGAIVAGEGLFF